MPIEMPGLQLNFARTKALDPRVTFSRLDTGASQASYYGADGLLKYASQGQPRFDHNPLIGESLGLLIEEQRTNLLTYSEWFDNAVWIKNSVSVTANIITAPDGTTTSDKLVENTAGGVVHGLTEVISVVSGTTYTFSVFAKAAERSEIVIQLPAGSAFSEPKQARFNLTTGTLINYAGTLVGSGISPVGNGWYRVWLSATATATGTVNASIYISVTSTVYTGDGTSGLYLWGAQLEAGAFPTSYIPTVASAVTRAVDIANMTGANFSSWYRQDEGTFVASSLIGRAITTGNFPRPWEVHDGTSNNRIANFSNVSVGGYIVVAGGVTQVANYPAESDAIRKVAVFAYKANDFAHALNGGALGADTGGTVPVVSRLNIGDSSLPASSHNLNGTIARLTYYPKRLSNAQLQALSGV